MRKEPRLHFTDEERADPALEKPIRKADRAAAKADRAQAKIPKKQVRQKTVDPKTGKVTTKLVLEDKKKPPSKLSHAVRDAPGDAVLGKLHKEIRETEQDNVGVESAHKSEESAETGVRLVREGYRSHKLKPYRKAAQAERQLEKANVNVLYQKSLQENPQFASNPLSRWQQKQAIKKQYAAAKHAGQTAGNTAQAASKTGKAARTVKEKAQQAGAFVMRHKKGFLMAGVLFLITCMLMNTMSSCSMMAQSIGSVLSGTTYPSDDPEMLAVEADYAAREVQLQEEIDNIENSHPGYDEYRYDLGMIGHDPHELAAVLSAVLQGYTRHSAQAELDRVFDAQYQLTLREEIQIRTYTDEDGDEHEYAKDSRQVYFHNGDGKVKIIKGAEVSSFRSLGDTYFARDEKRIYAYGKQLPKAELTSWELLGHWYSRDAKRVYYLNREIKGADRDSFTVCTPVDAAPFADHLARDKDHFYQSDEIIEETLWRERLHELMQEQ